MPTPLSSAFFGALNDNAPSTSVTIHASADFALVMVEQYDTDTIAATLGGNSPDIAYQAAIGGSDTFAAFGWVDPPTGSQTLAFSGGTAGDEWIGTVSSWSDVDPDTPWDDAQSSATPSAAVDTDADSVAVGFAGGDGNPTPNQTQMVEGNKAASTWYGNLQRAAGTGGSVTLSWSGFGTLYGAVWINLRHASGGGASVGRGNLLLLGVS